jgi:hypothetical protein
MKWHFMGGLPDPLRFLRLDFAICPRHVHQRQEQYRSPRPLIDVEGAEFSAKFVVGHGPSVAHFDASCLAGLVGSSGVLQQKGTEVT